VWIEGILENGCYVSSLSCSFIRTAGLHYPSVY